MPRQGGPQVVCDEILVQAAKSGDARSFETLSERYRQQLLRVAHRITRSREDAEDAVQDALLSAFVHMGDFEGRCNFGTWITSITVNSALMILRKKRGSQEVAIGGNHEFGSDNLCCQRADHAPNPEACCAQNETKRILRAGIAGLRPNLKVVVEIHLQGRSMPETAEALGISLSAAKGRLFHARKALRRSAVLRTTNRKLRY